MYTFLGAGDANDCRWTVSNPTVHQLVVIFGLQHSWSNAQSMYKNVKYMNELWKTSVSYIPGCTGIRKKQV